MNKFEKAKQVLQQQQIAAENRRIERLQQKAQPKTPIEIERPYYKFVYYTCFFLQLLTFLLALGIVVFAKEELNKYAALLLIAMFVATEPVKFYLNKYYNEQKLYQDYTPKIAPVLMFAVAVWSVGTSFIGTPYAVKYAVKAPQLIHIDSLQMQLNNKLTTDTAFWSNKAHQAKADATAYFSKRSWKGKLRSEDNKVYKSLLSVETKYKDSLTTSQAAAITFTQSELTKAEQANNQTLLQHDLFCNRIGIFAAIACLFLELLTFLGIKYWNNFEKRELQEHEGISELIAEPKPKKPAKPKPINLEVLSPAAVMNKANKIGFNKNGHGDIIKGTGRKKDRILYQKSDGSLKAYTLGEFDNLIRAAKTESKKEELNQLRTKLVSHGL